MKMESQNTEFKMADESPVHLDEVVLFHPEEDETARLREEFQIERDKYLRLAAEFENYRRRTKREQAEASEKGKRELLVRLISLADDFDLALANVDDASDRRMVEGLQLIERCLKSVLEANDVVAFDSAGEIFNPELHEAFDVLPSAEGKSGRVHSEIRRGYFLNDKLLRPALVVVAQ
jgi:molecular chaperone GrpE